MGRGCCEQQVRARDTPQRRLLRPTTLLLHPRPPPWAAHRAVLAGRCQVAPVGGRRQLRDRGRGVGAKRPHLLIPLLVHAPDRRLPAAAAQHAAVVQPRHVLQRAVAAGVERVEVLAARAKDAEQPAAGGRDKAAAGARDLRDAQILLPALLPVAERELGGAELLAAVDLPPLQKAVRPAAHHIGALEAERRCGQPRGLAFELAAQCKAGGPIVEVDASGGGCGDFASRRQQDRADRAVAGRAPGALELGLPVRRHW